MQFSKRISEEIKASNLTQKQIAELLNISEGNITNWKKGRSQPSIEMLCAICNVFDTSADYLIGRTDSY